MSEVMKVINKWGFTYRTIVFVLGKLTENNEGKTVTDCDKSSEWTRENTEFCIVATKRRIKLFKNDIQQVTICCSEESYHKPEYFKEMTIRLLGDSPTLELFPNSHSLDYVLNFYNELHGNYEH